MQKIQFYFKDNFCQVGVKDNIINSKNVMALCVSNMNYCSFWTVVGSFVDNTHEKSSNVLEKSLTRFIKLADDQIDCITASICIFQRILPHIFMCLTVWYNDCETSLNQKFLCLENLDQANHELQHLRDTAFYLFRPEAE